MKGNQLVRNKYAVNEVLGGILLVIVAMLAFSIIYFNVTSQEVDVYNKNVKIMGYVTDEGIAVLEHIGGKEITSYEIQIRYVNDTLINKTAYTTKWEMGECIYPLDEIGYQRLMDEDQSVKIIVLADNEDGDHEEIFNSILSGKKNYVYYGEEQENESVINLDIPFLVSSLKNNSVDEDLICFVRNTSVNITPSPEFFDYDIDMNWQIDSDDVELVEEVLGSSGSPGWIREDVDDDGDVDSNDVNIVTSHLGEKQLCYIYNWTVNGAPINRLILPFNTQNNVTTTDYSGFDKHGSVNGPVWTSNGLIGGCYQFNTNGYINSPYCFSSSYIADLTVETWIKTNADDQTICSIDPDNYFALELKNSVIRFSTTSNGNTEYTDGSTIVNDNNWHHIAARYEASTGETSIFVDGINDASENKHGPGDLLGDGNTPAFNIGKGTGTVEEEVIFSTSFETEEEKNKWSRNEDRSNDWAYNGVFERFGSESITPNSGSYSAGGTGDMYYWYTRHHVGFDRESIDISGFSNVTLSIYYSYHSTENDDEFGFYYWDGSNWQAIFEEFSPGVGEGNQASWTYSEVDIPDSINTLNLEFWWSTSSSREYVAIDDLNITGIPTSGSNNFTGLIDEFKVYDRVLSNEQIYQNYISRKNGFSDFSVISSSETNLGEIWNCYVTPNDGAINGEMIASDSIVIVDYEGGS